MYENCYSFVKLFIVADSSRYTEEFVYKSFIAGASSIAILKFESLLKSISSFKSISFAFINVD